MRPVCPHDAHIWCVQAEPIARLEDALHLRDAVALYLEHLLDSEDMGLRVLLDLESPRRVGAVLFDLSVAFLIVLNLLAVTTTVSLFGP